MDHSKSTGSELHDPKGKTGSVNGGTGTGVPLDLNDNTANAFHIRNNGAGTAFAIDTTNGAERLYTEYATLFMGDQDLYNLFVGSFSGSLAGDAANIVAIGNDITLDSTTDFAVVIGAGAEAITDANSVVVIGAQASGTATYAIAIGYSSSVSGLHGVALGASTQVTGDGGIAIGTGARATAESAIAIGYKAQNAVANSCLIGTYQTDDDYGWIDRLCLGRGWDHPTAPSTVTIQVTDATTTISGGYTGNGNGSGLTLRAGLGAGSGTSGDLVFETGGGTQSAGTPHVSTERMRIYGGSTGRIDITANAFLSFANRSAPSAISGCALLYAKNVSGTSKLFAMDGSGAETQLTP